jgi:hypothetical protein
VMEVPFDDFIRVAAFPGSGVLLGIACVVLWLLFLRSMLLGSYRSVLGLDAIVGFCLGLVSVVLGTGFVSGFRFLYPYHVTPFIPLHE